MSRLPIEGLSHILKSLRIKQEACQVIATEDKSAPIKNYAAHSVLIQKGAASDVSLWMLRPHEIQRTLNSEEAMLLAESYGVTADAIQLLLDASDSKVKGGTHPRNCVNVLADAQALLRSTITSLRLPRDQDQYALFMMLRIFTKQRGIFIRHLSESNPTVTLADVRKCRRNVEKARLPLECNRQVEMSMVGIQGLVSAKPQDETQWHLVADGVARLIRDGVKPSDVQLRECLLPIYEEIPTLDDYPKEFGQVLNAIDSYLATRHEAEDTLTEEVQTQEVMNVRKLLEGHKVVLIGGCERPSSKRKLEQAFALETLIWISTTSRTLVDEFEPYVQKPNVAVVLLAIRFASHRFGEVKHCCDKTNVPFVRLPTGYGISQVARQVLSQCGNRLKIASLSV